jgi:hypothetical protein
MMQDSLVLKYLEHADSRQGREIILSFTTPFSEELCREWIHLPSLHRVRLKPVKGSDAGVSKARIKGLGKDALSRGDRFVALNAPRVSSQRFFGYLDDRPRLPVSGELERRGQKLQFRISAAPEKGAGIVLLDLNRPLDLVAGKSVKLGEMSFTPLTVHCYRKISRDTIPFKAQGWMPKDGVRGTEGSLKSAATFGCFLFFPPWLDWVRGELQEASRKEGGLETGRLSSLLGIPPYLVPDLLLFLSQKKWFYSRKGTLLDAGWDYSSSLSPMSRGILEELRKEGVLLEKIAGSPRHRTLELLVRTGLAVEMEEGLFMEVNYQNGVYQQVAELRKNDPDIGLSELARRTGLKKRFLIPLLRYGDEME